MIAQYSKRAVFSFNLMPAGYADASWYDAPAAVQARLVQLRAPAARRALSDWLLERYRLGACMDFDFSDPPQKAICLREPGWLRRLATLLGLLRHREQLRRLIGDGTLGRLAAELGPAVVQRALVRWPKADFLSPTEAPIDRGAAQLEPQLLASGARWLLGWLGTTGHACAARVRFKFPRALAEQAPLAMEPAAGAACLQYLQAHVLEDG